MKQRLLSARFVHLLHQRNSLFLLVMALLTLNFFQACALLVRSERVVVIPPHTTASFWVEKNRVSPSYLEEMALFFANLILETTPESAAYKRDIILRNTLSEGYGALKTKLLEDEGRLKKERVVTAFQPNGIKVNPAHMTVEITGDLLRFVGEKRISQSRDTYGLTFVYRNARLLIKSFHLLRSDRDV